jgi:hypothetical protein
MAHISNNNVQVTLPLEFAALVYEHLDRLLAPEDTDTHRAINYLMDELEEARWVWEDENA